MNRVPYAYRVVTARQWLRATFLCMRRSPFAADAGISRRRAICSAIDERRRYQGSVLALRRTTCRLEHDGTAAAKFVRIEETKGVGNRAAISDENLPLGDSANNGILDGHAEDLFYAHW